MSRIDQCDVDGALEFYEPGAVLAPQPHEIVRGRNAIRQSLEQLEAMESELTIEVQEVLEAGDTALVVIAWTMTDKGGDGQTSGKGVNVVRRSSDGRWRILIDNPSGTGAATGAKD